MPLAVPPMRLAFLLLAAGLLVVAAAVVASFVSLHDPVLAAIIAVAGLAGTVGGAFAYAVSREQELAEGEEVDPIPAHPATVTPIAAVRAPVRIQSLPVADLPPAYLAAVMKGVQAHRAADQARVLPGVGLRH